MRIFGTKLDLFLEVFARAAGRIRDAFAAVLDDGPFDPASEDDKARMGLPTPSCCRTATSCR